MKIACCIWALAGMETEMLREAAALGFDRIDIQPTHLGALESRLLAQELGLRVSCLGASFGMPAGAALDSEDSAQQRAAFDHVASGIALAGHLGAEAAYIVPAKDRDGRAVARLSCSLTSLADLAAGFGVKLALEHFPGTALPTASETLEFIRRADHPNLYLLIDSGHLQMTGEDPASAILNAGDRLGYMHFDDNDGISDLHWALLDGVMTEESLDATLRALADVGYQGALSLELNPGLPNPARALAAGRDLLLRAMHRL